jgi:hypothetical protein
MVAPVSIRKRMGTPLTLAESQKWPSGASGTRVSPPETVCLGCSVRPGPSTPVLIWAKRSTAMAMAAITARLPSRRSSPPPWAGLGAPSRPARSQRDADERQLRQRLGHDGGDELCQRSISASFSVALASPARLSRAGLFS